MSRSLTINQNWLLSTQWCWHPAQTYHAISETLNPVEERVYKPKFPFPTVPKKIWKSPSMQGTSWVLQEGEKDSWWYYLHWGSLGCFPLESVLQEHQRIYGRGQSIVWWRYASIGVKKLKKLKNPGKFVVPCTISWDHCRETKTCYKSSKDYSNFCRLRHKISTWCCQQSRSWSWELHCSYSLSDLGNGQWLKHASHFGKSLFSYSGSGSWHA